MEQYVPIINFGLLIVLAVAGSVAAVIKPRAKTSRILLVGLALNFWYVVVFIFFFSVNPQAKPDVWWLDLVWGRIAYWPLYTALIVAFVGYIFTDPTAGEVDDETRRIVDESRDA